MRLFYGAASPFARIVRIALLETGLDPQVRKQEVTLRDPTSALLPYNPVGRVPTLELVLEGIVTWARELRRPDNARSPSVIALETTRVNRTADVLDRAVAKGGYSGEINAAHIVLGCALGWVDPRHPVWTWRAGRPTLTTWFEAIAATPSFQATVPPPL